MTALKSNTRAKVVLVNVARVGLARTKRQDVKSLALGVWHKGYTPDLKALEGDYLKDVGYLLDRLARFNVLPPQRKLKLFRAVAKLKPGKQADQGRKFRDRLASEWGASTDYSAFKDDLLPLQTRHFKP
ncbi:hypothetical protein FNU76_20530 [Chitinimonas arctica]|uniref:Uncharacterized protein n=1 Tax=Chitinimonas arctica TaxID=2594795 RepID=A0A516SK69_9NEIS|nr:hypothetical protein [Chitinimonas arctica]QDQ28544.1 hypothetical protein FNU76_20530 [Chitinimonas arctica]